MASLFFRSLFARPSRLLVALPLLFTLSSAQAELELNGWYTGFMYSDSSEKLDQNGGGTQAVSKGHLKLKSGKALNEYLSVEGQLGMAAGTGRKRGRFSYGLYLRPYMDFGSYRLYGLLGATGFYDYDDRQDNVSESGASWGIGIEVFGNKNAAISLEYLHMIDKTISQGDYVYESLGLGLSYYFMEDSSYFSRNRNRIESIRY